MQKDFVEIKDLVWMLQLPFISLFILFNHPLFLSPTLVKGKTNYFYQIKLIHMCSFQLTAIIAFTLTLHKQKTLVDEK